MGKPAQKSRAVITAFVLHMRQLFGRYKEESPVVMRDSSLFIVYAGAARSVDPHTGVLLTGKAGNTVFPDVSFLPSAKKN